MMAASLEIGVKLRAETEFFVAEREIPTNIYKKLQTVRKDNGFEYTNEWR